MARCGTKGDCMRTERAEDEFGVSLHDLSMGK